MRGLWWEERGWAALVSVGAEGQWGLGRQGCSMLGRLSWDGLRVWFSNEVLTNFG